VKSFTESLETSMYKPLVAQNRRIELLEKLDKLDFPTSRSEAWKYTRVTKISKSRFTFKKTGKDNIAPFLIENLNAYTLVFINGFYAAKYSDEITEDGLTISPFSLAKQPEIDKLNQIESALEDVFSVMNEAYAQDGVFIHLEKNTTLSKPIQLVHVITEENTTAQLRNLIVVGQSAQAEIIQTFYSDQSSNGFSNIHNQIIVGKNAKLTIEKIQYEKGENFHICRDNVKQEADSVFTINTITLDGKWIRNDLNIDVIGQNATTHLNGAYLTKDSQHIDNHTIVNHQVPNCESFELYKGVMDENSTAVFNGKVFVRKDAQKINAFQSNANVLLSENAGINSKPELEIYADDVKCSHGSTTGQLDDEAIFYLQARGLSKSSAIQLLVSAFIGDVLNKITNESVRNHIDTILLERFGWEF
jgi:Fe-S cluster assembly protein SufD